jgi:hypothetical protein
VVPFLICKEQLSRSMTTAANSNTHGNTIVIRLVIYVKDTTVVQLNLTNTYAVGIISPAYSNCTLNQMPIDDWPMKIH